MVVVFLYHLFIFSITGNDFDCFYVQGTSINLLHGKSSIGSVICFVIRPCKTASITAV